MEDLLAKNKQYKLAFTSKVHKVKFYTTIEGGNYHMSRYIAAGHQNIYSASGATEDFMRKWTGQMLDIVNNQNNKDRLRSDCSVMLNNLAYRQKYPVDEDCGLRMGAIYLIAQDEDPDTYDNFQTERKVKLAKGNAAEGISPDPDLYTFFLTLGIVNTPSWQEHQTDTIGTEYFLKRREMLQSLTPLEV